MCYWLICVLLTYGVEISKQFFDFFCLTKSKCKTALTTLTTQRYLKIYSVYALNTFSTFYTINIYEYYWHTFFDIDVFWIQFFFIWTIVPDLTVDADKDVVVFVPHQQLPMSETKSLLCIIILYNFNINYFTVFFLGISRNRKVGFKSN